MTGPRTLLHAGRVVDIADAPAAAVPEATLLDVARDVLGVRSASRGCQDGTCGSCRLLVGGRVVNACRMSWTDVSEGACVESYEDVEHEEAVARTVRAFHDERPTRCTLCVGGLGVTAASLARARTLGEPDAVEKALTSATCACTGRGSWRRALMKAR